MLKHNFKINTIYTSLLKRATETTDIVAQIINFPNEKIKYHWRLNERHYGALQGLNKSETAAKYGEDQVHIWRRSYDVPPPLLDINDKRHPRFNTKFQNIDNSLPRGESLKDVVSRLQPFWKEYVDSLLSIQGDHLIVAHSNSLRAIIKVLDKLSSKEIMSVNIPTGVPLVYVLDESLNVLKKEYLIKEEELTAKLEIIENQGKAK